MPAVGERKVSSEKEGRKVLNSSEQVRTNNTKVVNTST